MKNDIITLINNDCLLAMPDLKPHSIDLILTDLPYGTTQNKWDEIIPLKQMWDNFLRIIKPNGAMVFTATQPFSSKLVMSNLKHFKYELVWEKTISSGQLNIKRQPLRSHETILVFYQNQPTYNEQKTHGKPYTINRKITFKEQSYGAQKENSKINDGFRHAKSIIKIPNPRIRGGHPTQKPVALMEYIIKTYTNKGDLILDACMGSGTTGVACINLDRSFIGIEIDKHYFDIAYNRLVY